jgi:hypothetical protein
MSTASSLQLKPAQPAQLGSQAGPIKGRGTGTSDSIRKKLPPKSFVIPAAVVKRYGNKFFDRLEASVEAEGPAENQAEGGTEEDYCKGGKVRMAGGGLVSSKNQADYDAATQSVWKNAPLADVHPIDTLQSVGDRAFKALGENSGKREKAISAGLQKPSMAYNALGSTGSGPGKAIMSAAQNFRLPSVMSSANASKKPGYAKGGKVAKFAEGGEPEQDVTKTAIAAAQLPDLTQPVTPQALSVPAVPPGTLGSAPAKPVTPKPPEQKGSWHEGTKAVAPQYGLPSSDSASLGDRIKAANNQLGASLGMNPMNYKVVKPGIAEGDPEFYAKGGLVDAKVSNGERLMSPAAVKFYGPEFFNTLIKSATGKTPPKLGSTPKKSAVIHAQEGVYVDTKKPKELDKTAVDAANTFVQPIEQASKAVMNTVQQAPQLASQVGGAIKTAVQTPSRVLIGQKGTQDISNAISNAATGSANYIGNKAKTTAANYQQGAKDYGVLGGLATAAFKPEPPVQTPQADLPKPLRIQQQVANMSPADQAGYQQSLAATRQGMARQNAKPQSPDWQWDVVNGLRRKVLTPQGNANQQAQAQPEAAPTTTPVINKPAAALGSKNESGLRNDNSQQNLYWGEKRFSNSGDPLEDAAINYRQGLWAPDAQAVGLGTQRNAEDIRHNKATEAQDVNTLAENRRQFNAGGNRTAKPLFNHDDIVAAMDPESPVSEFTSARDVFTNPRSRGYEKVQQMMQDINNNPADESTILAAFAKASGISVPNLTNILRSGQSL